MNDNQIDNVVNSHNEWDPLEEVIVGRVDGAYMDRMHVAVEATIPPGIRDELRKATGRHYPEAEFEAADADLRAFIELLEKAGVKVRRPDVVDYSEPFSTPDWSAKGWCSASPRDGILVMGDQLIETPCAWRVRYFEVHAYRKLLSEYFHAGARWVSAPKPILRESLFDQRYVPAASGTPETYVINEDEVIFDAADFVRCGRDLFVAQSHTTNDLGIQWLQRHLGKDYCIHRITSRSPYAMHIDTTFVPLAPGKVLVNPEYVDPNGLPEVLKSWDVLVAPQPDPSPSVHNTFSSSWLSMNILMLDPETVFVERSQTSLARALESWGFRPVLCPFANLANYGGSFHCATLDIRRRGALESYF